jgi:hypothetical protein
MMEAESLVQNSGQNLLAAEFSTFTFRYSNENILSFWYQSQAIQKPKFIYAYRTTTFMRD